MKKSFVVATALLLLFSFSVGAAGVDEGSKDETEFIIANGAEPQTLDPHKIEGVPEHRIYMALFEGLMTYDPKTGRAIAGLAESWEVDDSGTVWTFKLRNAKWTDGVKITAQTVVDSWIRELAPETASQYAWFPNMFIKGAEDFNSGDSGPDIVAVRAVDDRTFQFETVGPLPYVLDALPHYAFAVVPVHAIEEHGDKWILPENFVGNGPFVLEEWRPQEYVSVVPNKQYWDADAVSLDRVIFLASDNNDTNHTMFLNSEVDWVNTVPLEQMDAVKQRKDYQNSPYLGTYYYLFNNEAEPFDDARVRKALSLAIDREVLVERITKGGQLPAYSMTPAMDGYPVVVEGYGEKADRIAEAKKLMADAGYPDGKGWPEVVLLYNTSEGHKKIGEYIQNEWKENLGIDIKLENQEWKVYLETRNEHDFQVARAGWIGDYPDPNTFLDMFLSGSAGNDGQYSNMAFDDAIKKASDMRAGTARFDVLREAENYFITKDQGVMPIYFYTSNNMIDLDKWGGWHANVMDYHPPKNIYRK